MGFDFRAQAFDYKAFGLGNIKKKYFCATIKFKAFVKILRLRPKPVPALGQLKEVLKI